jgi:hypothetical protein
VREVKEVVDVYASDSDSMDSISEAEEEEEGGGVMNSVRLSEVSAKALHHVLMLITQSLHHTASSHSAVKLFSKAQTGILYILIHIY